MFLKVGSIQTFYEELEVKRYSGCAASVDLGDFQETDFLTERSKLVQKSVRFGP